MERELLPTTEKVTQQLVEFEDTQSAMYLLRLSFGIVRANHFMRTTPLRQWEEQAKKFDASRGVDYLPSAAYVLEVWNQKSS